MDKSACHDAKGKLKPNCRTTDGIVVEHVQTDREKRLCTSKLMSWWAEQQKIEAGRKTSSGVATAKAKTISAKPKDLDEGKWP
ncbi:MAG: hypothetical protein KDI55_00025 [Anaerolineae bacterium]|nr:hypothetical protein [Anaerolineae bacterium]